MDKSSYIIEKISHDDWVHSLTKPTLKACKKIVPKGTVPVDGFILENGRCVLNEKKMRYVDIRIYIADK